MTLDAWRSAAGSAWRLLLLYPSGLTLLVGVGLLWLVSRGSDGLRLPDERLAWFSWSGPLVMLAFFPAPQADEIRAPLDLFVAIMLLELPLWLAIGVALCGSATTREWAAQAVASALTAAPMMLLALTLWAKAPGITLADLTALDATVWFWMGLACMALGCVPALLLGPWHAPITGPWQWALNARRVGYAALIALPLWRRIPLPEEPQTLGERLLMDGRWSLAGILIVAGIGFGLLHILTRRRSPVWWGRGIWALGAVSLVVWLVMAGQTPR